MIKHFLNPKSLLFYGSMVGSVFLIFKAVTWYGENNLQAPPKLIGEYALEADNLPSCLGGKNLVLTIEQSGIYLSGFLRLKTNASPYIFLKGTYEHQKIVFLGVMQSPNNCFNHQASLTINAEQLSPHRLSGTIVWQDQFPDTNFTAELQLNRENLPIKEH